MGKDKINKRNRITASWYVPMIDGDSNEDEEVERRINPPVYDHTKSKSWDLAHNKGTSLSKSKADEPNSLEWLKGVLQRQRCEKRVYKYNTQLIESIPGGDTAFMNRMLAMGANPNATCRQNHISACHIAAMYNHGALALLIKAGAETQRFDRLGNTPLHLAAWAGNARQIAILLNLPKVLQESIAEEIPDEILEEVNKYSEFARELINLPCNPSNEQLLPNAWVDGIEHNCRYFNETLPLFRQGSTALHVASVRCHHHCVQLLIAAGADVFVQDSLNRTPFDIIGLSIYKGHKVNQASFRKTIRTLLNAGSNLQRYSVKQGDTLLHTAVELQCVEAVEELMNNGASVTIWNTEGLTAMHVSVAKRNKEILQLLLYHDGSYENLQKATVDTVDQFGYTVLHMAVNEGWVQGVCIALGAGANITLKANNGNTPLHTAAALGDVNILQEILSVSEFLSTPDITNNNGETALFCAIKNNKFDAVRLLLKTGANIEKTMPNQLNTIHIAANYGNIEILEYLLEYNSLTTAKMINSADHNCCTPLFYAVIHDHKKCVELLIKRGANVNSAILYSNGTTSEDIYTTPLHVAAIKNYYEIAQIITDYDIKTINCTNSVGRFPLHEACFYGNKSVISLLLRKGADLSARKENSKTKLTPINMLMNSLPKPTEFMEETFDSYITKTNKYCHESNCEVVVNYRILVPNDSDRTQMEVIKALVNTGNAYEQNRLLLHPLVQSFLYLKWKSLLPFFYITLALHLCFVTTLNLYVIAVFYYKDKNQPIPLIFLSNVWKYIVYINICLIALQETIFFTINCRRYWVTTETWLKLASIALALCLLQIIAPDTFNPEWTRLIATFALLVSWFELMFLLSRFPKWGFYVLMFGKVAKKVLKMQTAEFVVHWKRLMSSRLL